MTLSARRRTELVLLPMLFHRLALFIHDDPRPMPEETVAGLKTVIADLDASMRAPLDGLAPDDQKKIHDRARRVQKRIFDVFARDERPVATCYAILCHLTHMIIDSGYVVVHDGSPFVRAYESLLDAIDHADTKGLLQDVDRSARRTAARILDGLKTEGYFQ